MKLLEDASCFDLVPLHRNCAPDGSKFFYSQRRGAYRALPFWVEDAERQMFYCDGAYEVTLLPGAHFRRVEVHTLSVEFVMEGRLYIRQRNRAWILEPGEIFLMQPDMQGEFLVAPGDFCHKLSITVSGLLLRHFLRESELEAVDTLTAVNREKMESFFRRFAALSERGETTEQNALICFELLNFLREPRKRQSIPEPLQELRTYMEQHYRQPITVEELAARAKCSAVHLNRLFHKFFGTTPYRMLVQIRMRRAVKFLLDQPDCSIKEIAQMAGYADALNFSTEFRRHFRLSPQAYRQSRSRMTGGR